MREYIRRLVRITLGYRLSFHVLIAIGILQLSHHYDMPPMHYRTPNIITLYKKNTLRSIVT